MNPRGGDAAYYVSPGVDPAAVHLQNGALQLSARPTPASLHDRVHDAAFVSGLITTARAQGAPTFRQRFGYYEVRARLPAGRGVWPAFWLRDAFGGDAEIDVFELLGDDPHTLYQSVHYVNGRGSSFPYRLPFDPTTLFHDYGVLVNADHDTWYVDGKPTHVVDDASTGPLYPIVSMQVGARGSWPGPPDGTTAWPATLSLKRFVAYRDAGQPCPTPTARSSPRR